jgi:hypothetical protein
MDVESRHCRVSGVRGPVPASGASGTRKPAGVLIWLALLLGPANLCRADLGRGDPWFTKLPFEKWLSDGERTDIPWSADILPAQLSPHQRLMLRVVIRLYGSELEKRRGAGEFVTLVQYTDGAGRIWQHQTALDLTNLPAGTGTRQLAIAQYAYVLPGDYSLAIAVCDTATLEHGLILRQVHAAPPATDPLPEAWTGLPAVDFVPPITEPPDVWYLPGVEGRLKLPVATRRPVHIHLLVNMTPSSQLAGSITAMQRNMNAVIPILKAFSQIDVRNGRMEAALLDLTHLRVAFEQSAFEQGVLEQSNADRLDWDRMRKIFLAVKPGMVDAHSLENRRKMVTFFRNELVRRLLAVGPGGEEAPIPVVIVLSGPAFLEDQEPGSPVQLPGNPDHRVFYIRYHWLPAPPEDDLQRAVEPLNARVYDAASNERVREVMAFILDQISKL